MLKKRGEGGGRRDDDSVPNLSFWGFFWLLFLSVYMKKLYSKKKKKKIEIGSARIVLHHKHSVRPHARTHAGRLHVRSRGRFPLTDVRTDKLH